MRPLESIDIILCRLNAKLFEESVEKTGYSSPIFIRRFMLSNLAKSFDKKIYLFLSTSSEECFELIDEEFGKSTYGTKKYTKDQMFWIGYMYRVIAIKYNLSSKAVYKLFNAEKIVKYYNIGHTFDVVDFAERMMASINYDASSNQEKALRLMRKLVQEERKKKNLNDAKNPC